MLLAIDGCLDCGLQSTLPKQVVVEQRWLEVGGDQLDNAGLNIVDKRLVSRLFDVRLLSRSALLNCIIDG